MRAGCAAAAVAPRLRIVNNGRSLRLSPTSGKGFFPLALELLCFCQISLSWRRRMWWPVPMHPQNGLETICAPVCLCAPAHLSVRAQVCLWECSMSPNPKV